MYLIEVGTTRVTTDPSGEHDGTHAYTYDVSLMPQETLPDLTLDGVYILDLVGDTALKAQITGNPPPGDWCTVRRRYKGTLKHVFSGFVFGFTEIYDARGDVLQVTLGAELSKPEANRSWWITRSSRRAIDATDQAFKYVGRQVQKIWGG